MPEMSTSVLSDLALREKLRICATVAKPFVGEQFLATIAQVLAGGSAKPNH
jgi:hypothetical protein